MKKALIILLTLLTALIIMVSCDNSVDYPFDDDVPAAETPEKVPLTFEFLKDGSIEIYNRPENMVYSRNSGPNQKVESNIIKAEAGDRIRLYATRDSATEANPLQIKATSECYVYGNVMSLIDEKDFADKDSVFEYAFYRLFSNSNIRIHSSKKLVLPATTLATNCYRGMFAGCKGLTKAPKLPATELEQGCYWGMFSSCTGLTEAPDLPATTLAALCYLEMFSGCTSLKTAPALPATTLKNYCYFRMFEDCTSLTAAPELKAPTLVANCYEQMFYGCSSLNYIKCLATGFTTSTAEDYMNEWVFGVASNGTFVKADGFDGWPSGSNGIPYNWYYDANKCPLTLEFIQSGYINIYNTPAEKMYYTRNEGPKTEVKQVGIYQISVNKGDRIRLYSTRNSAADSYQYATAFRIYCSSDCYVYGNVMSLIWKENFENKSSIPFDYAFSYLFNGNTHLKNHDSKELVLPATALRKACYGAMFEGCAGLTTAPVLPAPTLENLCYALMFRKCTSLNNITCLATNISADACTEDWVSGVAENGTFTKDASMSTWPTGIGGIPSGWTVINR